TSPKSCGLQTVERTFSTRTVDGTQAREGEPDDSDQLGDQLAPAKESSCRSPPPLRSPPSARPVNTSRSAIGRGHDPVRRTRRRRARAALTEATRAVPTPEHVATARRR